MKFNKLWLTLPFAAALIACQSAPDTKLSYDQCFFPDSPAQEAPQWVCSAPVEGLVLQGVGHSPRMGAGMSMMTDAAAMDARSQIANSFSSFISSRMQLAIEEQTIDGQSISIANAERIQRSVTSMQLQSTRIYQTVATPAGGVYVLVGLNEEGYQTNLERLLEESEMTDDPALYQRFLMEEANQELDALREDLTP
ncbi:MAG: LPP20 family lipoprotein [Idiomarina sp.]|nr:LPP20 family lipoprotein [Idiomarina sp.]